MPRLRPEHVQQFAEEASALAMACLLNEPVATTDHAALAVLAVEIIAQKHQRRLRARDREAVYELMLEAFTVTGALLERQTVGLAS